MPEEWSSYTLLQETLGGLWGQFIFLVAVTIVKRDYNNCTNYHNTYAIIL